jgi:hypothetical protein
VAVDGIRARFDALGAEVGSIGERIKDIAAKAAVEINDLFGTDGHPAQFGIIQRLEQIANLAVSTPVFRQAAPQGGGQQAADPTPAGQAEPDANHQPAETTSELSPPPTSASSAPNSEGTSQS